MAKQGKQVKVWLPRLVYDRLRDEAALSGRPMAEIAREMITSRYVMRRDLSDEEIGALLRVAKPEEQRALLEALGIEDVERFAVDLLASAGVQLVECRD